MTPPKGYWVARVDVDDKAAYDRYRALNVVAFAKYGGRFLVRGPAGEVIKGTPRQHNVVVEFASYAQAVACVGSPEYRKAMEDLNHVGTVDLVIIEGFAGEQPAPPQPA